MKLTQKKRIQTVYQQQTWRTWWMDKQWNDARNKLILRNSCQKSFAANKKANKNKKKFFWGSNLQVNVLIMQSKQLSSISGPKETVWLEVSIQEDKVQSLRLIQGMSRSRGEKSFESLKRWKNKWKHGPTNHKVWSFYSKTVWKIVNLCSLLAKTKDLILIQNNGMKEKNLKWLQTMMKGFVMSISSIHTCVKAQLDLSQHEAPTQLHRL